MPTIGLRRILKQTIDNILDISQLSSFKIAGNGPRTTIVLRFDECMAVASVSPIHRSTPRSRYGRKPPIRMRRDRERMEQHRNLSAEIIHVVRENNSSRQYNKDENVNRICKDDSALHSISLSEAVIPARREKAQNYIQQEKRPAGLILRATDNEDEQDRDELQLFGFDLHKETRKTKETRVKTHNQSTLKLKFIKTLPLCVSAVTAHLTHLSKETRRVRTQRAHCKSPASKLDLVQANQ